ncbi:MAG: 2-oxoacid:acceptor oxidoreductase family protein [Firmicutes bacterium]|nr:2-oxoacid:acceptor oxidoreductase family protein [Bacillota bacterium]
MLEKFVFAGFGGQGVMFMGKIMAYAGMLEGKESTWLPSYGPEMRGGTANCSVVVSTSGIGSPIVNRPNLAVVMNAPSLDKFVGAVVPGGYLLVNSSLVGKAVDREDIKVVRVPVNDIAASLGDPRVANVVMVGVAAALTSVVDRGALYKALEENSPNERALEMNRKALDAGYEFAGREARTMA